VRCRNDKTVDFDGLKYLFAKEWLLDRAGRRSMISVTLMGMESPDNRRKADDSYRAPARR
jgi:hypothetical protein